MRTSIRRRWLGWGLALSGLCVLGAGTAAAQTTTGTIRGYVKDQNGVALSAADITARNIQTGVSRTATSSAEGAYVIVGLVPGTYEITARHIGNSPQARRAEVQVGATLLADFTLQAGAVEVAGVTVEAAAPTIETRTSEVAVNVTQQQINNLPTSSRNFLDLATLAPGTTIENDRLDGTARRFSAGAQSADQINVFIDGATYKNDLIHGGVVGQDRSRGNPFPRNAVQEFRVLTQNYKAEYQKSSSAVLTATTKSGTNVWVGNAFVGYQNEGFVALDSFARASKTANPTTFRVPDYNRTLVGLSGGGPLIRDRLFAFVSYEGNYQNRSNLVNIVPPTGFPALDTIDFASRNGFFGSPFRSTLAFGKLNYAAGPNSSMELSFNTRHETDTRDFGGNRPFESGVHFRNDVSTGILKHRYFRGAWLNEASVSYQKARDNPTPVQGGQTVNRFFGGSFCCAQIGPDITIQDFTQHRLAVRNDLSYAGLQWNGQHVLKGGVSFDFLSYSVIKQNGVIPRFVYEEFGPNPTAGVDSFKIPDRVEFRAGNPNFVKDNTQFGAYVQDDWSPTRALTLNLGIRWDYETNMLNYDYATPQAIRDSLTKYADRLFIPIDPQRYFTNGTQRARFKGAFQPRLGFSYALDEAGQTTVFGGFGIFYDRTLFDQAIEEQFALQQPNIVIRFRQPGDTTSERVDWNDAYLSGRAALDSLRIANPQAGAPEVKLIPNDLRPPRSTQFSAGVRRIFGQVVIDAAYTGVRSSNVFTFYWANMNFTCPERSFGVPGCFVNNPIPGYSTILIATNDGKTWYNALQVKVDRPYRRVESGVSWGAGLAYTFAKRQTEGFNDDFSFPNPVDYPRQVRNDEKHRVVANWIIDLPFAYGIQFGGLLTLGSGVRQDVGDRFGGTANPFKPGGFDLPTFKNVDLRLRKDFPSFKGTTVAVTADLFNAFNWQNLGDYNTGNPSDANFGKARGVLNDPRRLQIGAEYNF
jgi:carboxypeptidase family protein/TonB-dependent receptor-like protein